MAARRRLDLELVASGAAPSRAAATDLIAAGRVHVNGAVADKPARLVAPSDNVLVAGPPARFVGRGGEKLDAALSHFGVEVTGARYLDCGASTGGFTDCLLQRGAAHVVALDVGHGQLHPKLRDDNRVTVLERTNMRTTDAAAIGGPVDGVVVDVSFISLTAIIPALVGVCKPGATMVMLVKPQFEAGRAEVSKGRGIITDPAVHERVQAEVGAALEAAGCHVQGWSESPIKGGEGNVEFLVHATAPTSGPTAAGDGARR
ncbi:TlyA family RNA methyltransferase [Desertimonas flava]|uniref:TlyA family RNA methyltransferase n=1 Tax=Desertimonas flava TaxID=2064846 RepID=UPI0013C430CC|nr:TlyA family RNA methyltransferase [Desertimonas flava]